MMIKYLWQMLRHKWFVFLEACKLGIPWLGLIHDLSKFRPSEFFPYARYSGSGKSPKDGPHGIDFDYAWLNHQRRNKHHWQYWVSLNDPPILAYQEKPLLLLPMPTRYRREMLADWRGAIRTHGNPDMHQWYEKNKNKIILHDDTRAWLERELGLL